MRVYQGLDVWSDFGGRFPWKSRLLDTGDGVRMAYLDEGAGEPVFVLLHGNPTWGFLYRAFVRHLAPRSRVIVPDHVGFGRSDKPGDPAYYTLERHIENLSKVLDAADVQRAILVMQDWGGPIGTAWATRHPERVSGLVVLNTWAFVREPPMVLPWLFRFLVLGKGGWKRVVQKNVFTELFVARGGTRKLAPEELDAYRAAHPTPAERVGAARFPQLIAPTFEPAHESWATMAAIEDALPALRSKPALICWALKDPAFRRPLLERWVKTFAQVDGPHLLANAAHYLQEDAPAEILAAIDRWLPTLQS